jgi:chromosome segregation ATPase
MARSEVETLQHVNRVLAEQCDVQNAELAAAQLRIDALTESINGAAQKIVACAKARDAALSEVAQWKGRAEIAKKEIAATAARFCKQYKAEIAAVHGEQDALKAELAAEQEKSHIISRDHQVLEGELVTLRVLLKEACCDHMRDDHDDERQNKSVRDFRRRAAGVLHE